MGYFTSIEQEIMSMAHDMGDDFGEDSETIKIISRALQISVEEVQQVLEGDHDSDYDGQPDELTEWMDFDPDC
jgi:energy-converting hydrogenase A subunit M